jgi:hypothetical protein
MDPIAVPDNGSVSYYEGEDYGAIILDVKGETVYIDYGAPGANFDKVAPDARKVLDSVESNGA